MSHWSKPSASLELEDLQRSNRPNHSASAFDQRWYAVALLAGALVTTIVGLSTNVFDSGPTSLDVSAAYRDGIDRGTASAETRWAEAIDRRYWDAYYEGQRGGTGVGFVIAEGLRNGFSWEGGYEAGLGSPDIDPDASYWQGWQIGFQRGYHSVAAITPISSESAGEP